MRQAAGLLALLAVIVLPCQTIADPMANVTVVPAPQDRGAMHATGPRPVSDLEQEYVEEEYFVSGAATVYTYNDPPVRGDIVPFEEDVPYTTRIIIRRPANAADFNGTLIIEWFNSTPSYDVAPVWESSADYFARKGIAYVGVTNSTTSIDYLQGGCRLLGVLPPTCGTRYVALSMPENGQAYEMVSQIATLLKSSRSENPLPRGFRVERIFHSGYSQQGGSVVTYASAFHLPINDGYFIQAFGIARPINFSPACGDRGSPPYPDCTPRLQGESRLVRRDLPVPVYRAHTETDIAIGITEVGIRQTDTENFRYYEMAGTAHVPSGEDVEFIPAGLIGPDPVFFEDLCEFPSTTADGPIFGFVLFNAMWENMELQVRFGVEPPHGELIEVQDGEIERDRFGNARGGIRLPQMDVPVATYGPSNSVLPSLPPLLAATGGLICFLTGAVTPFDEATLDRLYPTFRGFVKQIQKRADKLVRRRLVLPEDVSRIVPRHVGTEQRNCILEVNRRGAARGGVLGKQNADNERCVRAAGRGSLSTLAVSECVTADLRFGIAFAEEWLLLAEATRCLAEPDQFPDFGYPGDGTESASGLVARVAREQSLGMLEDLFGPEIDLVMIDTTLDRQGRKCQAQILKAADDVLEKMIAEGIRGKSAGLKDGSILDAEQLAEAILEAIDEDIRGRVEARLERLVDRVEDKCLSPGVGFGNAFPGRCGPAAGGLETFAACVEMRARCRACLAFNGIDALDADCDEFDDGVGGNQSCAANSP